MFFPHRHTGEGRYPWTPAFAGVTEWMESGYDSVVKDLRPQTLLFIAIPDHHFQ